MTILLAWLLADFISGLVHWWEDRAMTGESRFAFVNSLRADNERHHKMPGYLTKFSWWSNINTTAPFAWALACPIYFVSPFGCMVLVFLGFGNLIHRWAHDPPAKLPRLVVLLQTVGLFISYNHHAGHHFKNGQPISRENSRIRFCVMSSWLNPILDHMHFFKWLEFFLFRGSK